MDKEKNIQTLADLKNSYEKIHKTIFKYGIFIILLIIWGITTARILNKEYTSSIKIDTSLEVQKVKLLADFSKKNNQGNDNQDIQTYIILGEIKKDDQNFESYNNLITYKWYVVPRLFWISNTMPLQPLSYYENNQYSLEDMQTFFKNIIIASNKDLETINKQTSLPLNNIISDFNLQCLFQTKIYNWICNKFTQDFINSFFLYNIQFDLDGFSKVEDILVKNEEYKAKICNQLNNYVLYSKTTNENIERLFSQCPQENKDKFLTFSSFLEVQKELENKSISSKVYTNDMINIYKLVSIQQIMYDDSINKRVNIDRIDGYLEFIQELLKKNKLSKIYKEIVYYFNNYYIKPWLESPEAWLLTDKSWINNSIKKINNINNGNALIGYEGLLTQINTNIIIKEKQYIETEDTAGDNKKTIEILLNQITNFDIQEKILSGNDILLKGTRSISQSKLNQRDTTQEIIKIQTKLRLQEKENTLYVKQIGLENHDDFSLTINKLIQSKPRSFADVEQYVKQNQTILNQKWSQSTSTDTICSDIKEAFSWQDLQTCNQSQIILDILRKGKVVSLSISHNKFIVSNINISNDDAKNIINNYIQQPETAVKIQSNMINQDTIIGFIRDLLEELYTYKPQSDNTTFQWSTNTIIIVEKIKTYLWTNVSDIVEKNDKILVQFSIKNINFIGNYDIDSHTIQPLYFKDVLTNSLPTLIKNVKLTLNDENKTNLDKFTIDPIEFIKENSLESFLLYEKFISEKNY